MPDLDTFMTERAPGFVSREPAAGQLPNGTNPRMTADPPAVFVLPSGAFRGKHRGDLRHADHLQGHRPCAAAVWLSVFTTS